MRSKILLILLVVFVYGNLIAQSNQNVIYGQRSDIFVEKENTIRIFYDKNGSIYPDDYIIDSELFQNESSLFKYYSSNHDKFIELSNNYGIEITAFNEKNFNKLQEIIIQDYVNKINSLGKESDIYFLIHGFRKPIEPKDGTTSSQQDNDYFQKSVKDKYADKTKPKFVEIYWNGMYDCCIGRKIKTNKRIFRLYENKSQKNATIIGYSLRNIVSEISINEFTIISHSLGGQVVSSLLFNTYDNRISENIQNIKTPGQNKINICLVAPAMSKKPFEEYYERSTERNFSENDNYFLTILFNEKDLVLKKKWKIFGPGPRKYGNTSLGCNHRNEALKLKKKFLTDYKNSKIEILNTPIGKTHLVKHYGQSLSFKNYIELIKSEEL